MVGPRRIQPLHVLCMGVLSDSRPHRGLCVVGSIIDESSIPAPRWGCRVCPTRLRAPQHTSPSCRVAFIGDALVGGGTSAPSSHRRRCALYPVCFGLSVVNKICIVCGSGVKEPPRARKARDGESYRFVGVGTASSYASGGIPRGSGTMPGLLASGPRVTVLHPRCYGAVCLDQPEGIISRSTTRIPPPFPVLWA
ncbi:hypothetical protein C8R44DRAFT_802921, partial [Mycena epipterygia]